MTDLTIAERSRARQMKLSLMEMLEGIRVRNGLKDCPKAVMTEAMAAKGTAVINCGDEEKKALKISEGILEGFELRAFKELYRDCGVSAERDVRRNLWNQPVPCIRLIFDLRRAK